MKNCMLTRFLGECEKLGYRSLVVLRGTLWAPRGSLIVSPRLPGALKPDDVKFILGSENKVVAVDWTCHPLANATAAAAETIVSGGALILWFPSSEPKHRFSRRVLRLAEKCRCRFIVDENGDVDVELPREPARKPPKPRVRVRGVPRRLTELCATREQADALRAYVEGGWKRLALVGDRGRGKSAALGLCVALAVYRREVGDVQVAAPSLLGVQSFFTWLSRGLEALGIRHRCYRVKGLVWRISGAWFRVRYAEPWRAVGAGYVVVDEAAALGVARVRRIIERSGRVLLATTVHGYEGSGRAARRLLEKLEATRIVELRDPVRYPPGDPLEEWLYKTFLLRIELPEPPSLREALRAEHVVLDRDELSRNDDLLEQVYSVLAEAHYRNEPDDLALILDAPDHKIHALVSKGRIVAVAHVRPEGPLGEDEAWKAATMGLRGVLVLDKVLRFGGWGLEKHRGVRVVRIAVHPALHGRGLGSKLLKHVEDHARSRGYGWIGAIFSGHEALGFWLRNGYLVVYISPRYNKRTGEKNIAVAKPLKKETWEPLVRAASSFKARLLLASFNVYRDLAAEKIARILRDVKVKAPVKVEVSPEQEERLELFLEGRLEYESAADALYAAAVNLLSMEEPPLGLEDLVVIVARTLQGKPLPDVASALGVSLEEAKRRVREAHTRLAEEYLEMSVQ